jgi:hypothetical protein
MPDKDEINLSQEEIDSITRWIIEVGPEVAMVQFAKQMNDLAEKVMEITSNRTLQQIDDFLEDEDELG